MTQTEYIAILFIDCGFDGVARRAWLQREFGKKYSDELSASQASECIDRLKEIKASAKEIKAGLRERY